MGGLLQQLEGGAIASTGNVGAVGRDASLQLYTKGRGIVPDAVLCSVSFGTVACAKGPSEQLKKIRDKTGLEYPVV